MWTDLPTLLLLQSIAAQAALPPMPKRAHFVQTLCRSLILSHQNQITLSDNDGKPMGTVFESCGPVIGSCKYEGFNDVIVDQYTVKHPNAIFGACLYHDVQIEISATDGFNTVNQQLFANCKVTPFLCDETTGEIGQTNEVIMTEFPSGFTPVSINLQEYNKDSCPADQNFGDVISNAAGCNVITNTGITNVVVVPKPDMPSTCKLTLYDDNHCISSSNAEIGPITPGSNPSACIGPIRNSKGDTFEAKGAVLQC